MIFHGHGDDSRKKNQIHPAEPVERDVLGGKRGGGHQEDTDPDPEDPDQADVVRRFSFDDPHDEGNIEKGEDDPRPRANEVKNFHDLPFSFGWYEAFFRATLNAQSTTSAFTLRVDRCSLR
jgi:hypothetical protein